MKPRKKTKLCLQCNGVNPISATHCAYCGAMLSAEEVERVQEVSSSGAVSQDLFASQSAPFTTTGPVNLAPYHVSSTSHGFVQDRQPIVSEERFEKPLYSVFDQPEVHQMGDLRDQVKVEASAALNVQTQAVATSFWEKTMASLNGLFSKKSENSSTGAKETDLKTVLAAGSLATGTTLITISLFTFIFSHEGRVVLSWSEQTAAWIMFLSIVMIVIGWKASQQENQR